MHNISAGKKKSPTRIAVPYYGHLVRPGAGIEKIYFVAEFKPRSLELRHITLRVWNPHEFPELPGWLKKRGISGLICSDVTLGCHFDFTGEGIWVMGGEVGEVHEIIRRWSTDGERGILLLAGFPPEMQSAREIPVGRVAGPSQVAASFL